MIPILYEESEKTFTTNGIGRLEGCISCTCHEELNGVFELELVYPATGRLFNELKISRIIAAIPYDGATLQAFRIYNITKPMNGQVSVYCEHITYQTIYIPVMPFTATSLENVFIQMKNNVAETCPFTFYTNKNVPSNFELTEPRVMRSLLSGEEGSILQKFKGEYEWDNWTIKLLNQRGSDNNVTLRYGKNITSIEQETNIENTYTGIVPYYLDTDNVYVSLPEKVVQSSQASKFPYHRTTVVDFTSDFETPPTVAQLRTRANTYITENNIGHPSVSIKVEFAALWQTTEYKDIAPLERVKLGDTIHVIFDKLDITEDARVIEYEYDVIRERYNSITIGEKTNNSLVTNVANQSEALTVTQQQTKEYATRATYWLTRGDGYLCIVKGDDGSWKELLAMDTPNTATAKNVLRLNQYGIGFSDSGINGPYTQAWTLDGVFTTGGINNSNGVIRVLDENGRLAATIDNGVIVAFGRDGSGAQVGATGLTGDGVTVENRDYTIHGNFQKESIQFTNKTENRSGYYGYNGFEITKDSSYSWGNPTALVTSGYMSCDKIYIHGTEFDPTASNGYATTDDIEALYDYIDNVYSELVSMIMSM